jgi:hypothetical protein
MENTPYNRRVAEQLRLINNRFLSHQDSTGKKILEKSLVPLVKPLIKYDNASKEGSGLLSGVLSTFGLGSPTGEGKRSVGRPRKVRAGEMQAGEMEAGAWYDDFATGFKMPFQLVNKVLGGKKRGGLIKTASGKAHYGKDSMTVRSGNGVGRPVGAGNVGMEGSGIFDDIGDFVGNVKKVLPLASLIGIGKKGGKRRKGGLVGVDAMAEQKNLLTGGKRRRGRPCKSTRKAGLEGQGILSGILGSIGLGEDMEGGKRRRGRPRKSTRKAGLEGEGLFDDILSNVGKVVKTAVDIAPHAKDLYKSFKGKGRQAGVKKAGASKWIQHVKAYAKKHNIPYNEALKKASSSYK